MINIDVPDDRLITRLSARRVCECGATYQLTFNPPKKEGVCDLCGGALYQRDDDTEESVQNRLRVYKIETKPLIDYYANLGLITTIDGGGSIKDISGEIYAHVR